MAGASLSDGLRDGRAVDGAALMGRTLLKVLVPLLLVVLLGVSGVWADTSPGSDIQQRVARIAADHQVRVLNVSELPATLVDALVATEDERFWAHHGVDLIGMSRALLYDATQACACQGGSTITQQLVKLVYLNGSNWGLNKVKGVALAFKVEMLISKHQILADYLSVVPFGYGLYGADAAACAYFGRHLGKLDLAQAAVLAGMPQAPSAYDPRAHPGAAQARRQVVLSAMVGDGYITSEQAGTAAAAPVVEAPLPTACT
jgi:membrane peptidoglycan carboxypeptidase